MYRALLMENGVQDYTFDQCLYDYRISLLHSLARQVIVVGGGFVAADQERKLCDLIVPRYIAAVLDLDAGELLPPLLPPGLRRQQFIARRPAKKANEREY